MVATLTAAVYGTRRADFRRRVLDLVFRAEYGAALKGEGRELRNTHEEEGEGNYETRERREKEEDRSNRSG